MSLEDKDKLQLEMRQKVLLEMAGAAGVIEHIEFSLNGFSHRYIESDSTGTVLCSLKADDIYSVLALEPNLAEALKTKNPTTRKGLIDLAKSSSKKDRPHVRYEIGVQVVNIDNKGGGDFIAFAEVHWGFPNFEDPSHCNRQSKKLNYEDAIDLRNNLARELDDLCTIF